MKRYTAQRFNMTACEIRGVTICQEAALMRKRLHRMTRRITRHTKSPKVFRAVGAYERSLRDTGRLPPLRKKEAYGLDEHLDDIRDTIESLNQFGTLDFASQMGLKSLRNEERRILTSRNSAY